MHFKAHFFSGSLLLMFAPLTLSQNAQQQPQTFDLSTGQDTHQPLEIPSVIKSNSDVDLTGVYFHLRQNNWSKANQELQRLKSNNPGWQPPNELLNLMAQTRDASSAVSLYDYDREIHYLDNLTPQQASKVWNQRLQKVEHEIMQRRDVFGANRLGRVYLYRAEYDKAEQLFTYSVNVRVTERGREGLAEVYYLKAQQAILNNKPDQAWLFKEKSAQAGHPSVYLDMAMVWRSQQQYSNALTSLQKADDSAEKQNALAEIYMQLGLQALNQQHTNQAIEYLNLSRKHGASDVFNSVGWMLYEQQKFSQAEHIFRAEQPANADSIYASVLSLRAMNQHDLAHQRACEFHALSATLAKACLNGIEEQVIENYEDKKHLTVVALETDYQSLTDEKDRPLAPIFAWSWLKLNENGKAYSRFDALLTDSPKNQDYAQAMIQILAQENDHTQTQVARLRHPLIDQLWNKNQFHQAWFRKQFDLAQRINPENKVLQGTEDWSIHTGLFWQQRSGSKGLSYLETLTPFIGASTRLNELRIDLKLRTPQYESGQPTQSADFADRPATDIREPISSVNARQPHLSAYWEQDAFNFVAEVGTTSFNAPVEQTPIGRLDLKWFGADWIAQGRLFRRSVDESLLSTSGTEKTTSNRAWGRVVDQGLYGGFTWLINETRAASFNLENSTLSGQDVKDNHRLSYRADFSWNIKEHFEQDWDYLRIGPYLSGLNYRNNLSYFTSGHGGYFSPQTNLNLGLFLSLLSAEGRDQQYKLQTAIGYEQTENNQVARFPLQPDGTEFASSSSSGLTAHFQYEHMWRLDANWMLGGFLDYNVSPDFNHRQLGALVRYSFAKRTGILSPDLPLYRHNN
mgnify:CR=1 FL=1